MDNEYTRKEVKRPLAGGDYCDREDKNCKVCIAKEDEWNKNGNCYEVSFKEGK